MSRSIISIAEWGPFVRARRSELGLTQDDVARSAGVSRQTIAKLERDAGDTTLRTFWNVARALELTIRLDDSTGEIRARGSDEDLAALLNRMAQWPPMSEAQET